MGSDSVATKSAGLAHPNSSTRVDRSSGCSDSDGGSGGSSGAALSNVPGPSAAPSEAGASARAHAHARWSTGAGLLAALLDSDSDRRDENGRTLEALSNEAATAAAAAATLASLQSSSAVASAMLDRAHAHVHATNPSSSLAAPCAASTESASDAVHVAVVSAADDADSNDTDDGHEYGPIETFISQVHAQLQRQQSAGEKAAVQEEHNLYGTIV